jgi:hypothetical protein
MNGPGDQCARAGEASRYVLGELNGREQESFVRHLRGCAACTEEVELLQQAADAVPLLAARHIPPPDELPAEPRLPMLSVAGSQSRRAAGSAGASTALTAHSTPPHQPPQGRPTLRSIPGGAGAPARPRLSIGGRKLLQSPVPKPALIGLLALAIVAIATVALSHRAASVRYDHIRAGWEGGGAALKLDGNDLELLVLGMPRAPHGSGYQVWLGDRLTHQLEPTTSWLHLNRAGEAGVSLPGDYHDWYAIAVYVEPLHGPFTNRSGAVVVGDLRHLR